MNNTVHLDMQAPILLTQSFIFEGKYDIDFYSLQFTNVCFHTQSSVLTEHTQTFQISTQEHNFP